MALDTARKVMYLGAAPNLMMKEQTSDLLCLSTKPGELKAPYVNPAGGGHGLLHHVTNSVIVDSQGQVSESLASPFLPYLTNDVLFVVIGHCRCVGT